MSCRPDLYKARTAIDRLQLHLRDIEDRLGDDAAKRNIVRAREHLAAADMELDRAVQLAAAPAVIFEVLR
ncbi:hypothetical protein EWE75_10005 [Sphingomonas populi]|uniref:Uncharacterized protein n=1 Tax=Sphingomonas populi TaxID=2484750 RepID=A0A4Q6XX09_9SPHN|nr:hypothetical protein [Sphingomonas populi]RZF64501.1 hypothetical protein EWE75_10005 [Sphingomonas populi]